jgi:hypothetical protein
MDPATQLARAAQAPVRVGRDPARHSGRVHELLFRQGHLVIGSSSARRAVPRLPRSGSCLLAESWMIAE